MEKGTHVTTENGHKIRDNQGHELFHQGDGFAATSTHVVQDGEGQTNVRIYRTRHIPIDTQPQKENKQKVGQARKQKLIMRTIFG